MHIMGTRRAAFETQNVDALVAEARQLYPRFIRQGQIVPDTELARLIDYNRFLRLGILLWMAKGQDGFREILGEAFACEGCSPEEATSHLGYLWRGIDTGCTLHPAPQRDPGNRFVESASIPQNLTFSIKRAEH